MKKSVLNFIFIFVLIFFNGCFNKKVDVSDFLISYELPKNALIDEALGFMKPAVDQIIKQELEKITTQENKDQLDDVIGFYCKDKYRLTVAYVNQYQHKHFEQLSDLIENLASEQLQGKVCFFDSKVDFFGKDQNAFVIKIDDKYQYLAIINETIKNRLHQAHKDFLSTKNQQLYSIEKSEAFDYKPHVHLATLYIRSKAGNHDRILLEPVLKIIFQRVKDEVLPQVNEIIKKSKHKGINIQNLSLINMTERVVAGTWPLKSE